MADVSDCVEEYRLCCQPSVSLMKIGMQVSCHSFSMSVHGSRAQHSASFSPFPPLHYKRQDIIHRARQPGRSEGERQGGKERQSEGGRKRETEGRGREGGVEEGGEKREREGEEKHFCAGLKDQWIFFLLLDAAFGFFKLSR